MVYLGQLIQPAPAPPITVAIKHLHLPTANPHLNRQNFQQLIATLSLANHPNVISYYGSHIVDEDCFLFLEYCSGGTLAEYLATNGPVTSKSQLAQWVHDAAAGLAYLHRSGVVHRDIKPSNIMIQDGKLKLTDLSSAKMHGACCPEVHDSKMAGTPAYLAPERTVFFIIFILVSKTHPTGAQDVWSLGCVIYELVVGSQPFADIDNVWSLYFLLGQYSRLHAASR
ncbi:kinase-like domain-containing protein, partial [Blastocladiella britannica]